MDIEADGVGLLFAGCTDMIDGLINDGALPTLERMMQFAGARHRIIANNLANASTPHFRPVDVSVQGFQQSLREAIEERKAGNTREIQPESTREIEFGRDGLRLHPTPMGENLLFHDDNDRNMERILQDLVENFMTFREASQLIRRHYDLINTAIRERL